jgi:hypothetical protein
MTSANYEKLWQRSKDKGALRKLLVSWQRPFQKFDLTSFNGHRDNMARINSMSGWSDVSSHKGQVIKIMGWVMLDVKSSGEPKP